MSKQLAKRAHPIKCTACGLPFQSWQNWHEHRAVIRAWEMSRHEEHTRRCLSPRQWAMLVLAECQGIQEDSMSWRQEDKMTTCQI